MDPECCTAAQLELIGVNAPDIAMAFLFGFGLVSTFWTLGFVAGACIRAIKQA